MRDYVKIPILDVARRCGLVLNSRTLSRAEVEAACPFCGDHGSGKFHLGLNCRKDVYYCVLCGARGNSVTLYARLNNLSNAEAFHELTSGNNIYKMPQKAQPIITEPQPAPIKQRNAVYTDMLSHLVLSEKHRKDLQKRGLSAEQIERNMYRTLPEMPQSRQLLAEVLNGTHDLSGIPGFFTSKSKWNCSGPGGLLIPVRDMYGDIQGFQIRLDDEGNSNRKYRWFSSRGCENGCRVYSWIHVAGNVKSRRAFLTEGAIKGDVTSALWSNELFICLSGVNSTNGLKQTIIDLGVNEVVEVLDMDKKTNPNVAKALGNIRSIVKSVPNVQYRGLTWDARYKGIDDYSAAFAAA